MKPWVRMRLLGQTYFTDYGREEDMEPQGAFGSQGTAGEGQLRRKKELLVTKVDTFHFTLHFSQKNSKTFVAIEQ